MVPFFQSLFLITIAEMGDKSQLVALAFATRYRPVVVLGGIFAATLLVHLFSVALGESLGHFIPRFWLQLAAGLAFIGFGIWTLRGDEIDEESVHHSRFGPFIAVSFTFFIAELGDKTMLATVTLASQRQGFIAIWLGSTFGMVLADALAIILGIVLGKRLPEKWMKYGATAIFMVTGLVTIALAF